MSLHAGVEVRLEYAWAPLDRWLEGRTGFLSSYLAHERLYLMATDGHLDGH